MPGPSTYLAPKILDHLFGSTRYTPVNVAGAASIFAKAHTGPPGPAGTANAAHETTRKQVPFAAASGRSIASNASVTWSNWQALDADHPDDVGWASYWDTVTDGTGNCLFTGPLGGIAPVLASVVGSTGVYTARGHSFAAGNHIEVYEVPSKSLPAGGSAPVADTHYVIYNVSGDTFQIATVAAPTTPLTGGGDGQLIVHRAIVNSYNLGDTVQFASGQFVLYI